MDLHHIEQRVADRYNASGYSWRVWEQHRALLRRLDRLAGSLDAVTIEHLQQIVLAANRTNSRAAYVEQLRSLWSTLLALGVVSHDPTKDLPTIKRTKSLPRPLTDEQVRILLTEAEQPYRD